MQRSFISLIALAFIVMPAFAQSENTSPDNVDVIEVVPAEETVEVEVEVTEEPAPEMPDLIDEPADTDEPSAEDVMNDMLERRGDNTMIAPEPESPTTTKTDPTIPQTPTNQATPPATTTPVAVGSPIGTAPQAIAGTTPVRSEGSFIVSRRGRLIPGPGNSWLFAFESDRDGLADPPMFVMPCRQLEELEAVVNEKGDSAIFLLTGEVFTYRGANYILPTFAREVRQQGNMQP